jgi:flagellar M-ring protein FliF
VQNLLSIWKALDLRRKAIVAGATLAVFLAVLALSRMAGDDDQALLYAGLEGSAAGEVIAALEQRGVAYQVRGDSIWVAAAQRDSLRMVLAADGLPANSGAGYELLDGLSGFGTTAQMFDAAYWRAKEGELARTIRSNPMIRAARVHVAQTPEQPFQPAAAPTASVTVTTASGSLPAAQARAIRHLVAAAIPGLRPDAVAVIDAVGGLIPPETDDPAAGSSAAARAAEIRGNVERLLQARVGPGKAVVEVAVDLVTEREQITERRIDPQGRVAISSETETKSGSSSGPEGQVTVASNLPDGQGGATGGPKSQSAENRERVNYEVSETQRDLLRTPGAIRRMTVAVLVDGQPVTAADGTVTVEPRDDAELSALRELVASAAGLDESRGDLLTIKSLAFLPPPQVADDGAGSLLPPMGPVNLMTVLQMAVLAGVALVLGLFVLRPLLLNSRAPAALPPADLPLALPGMAGAMPALTGIIEEDDAVAALPGDEGADPVARLRRLIAERQAESVEILRGWMEMEEERS